MNTTIIPTGIILISIPVTFLEMQKPPTDQLPAFPHTRFELLAKPISVSVYRHYYYGVGATWQWLDRMVMPDEELFDKINALHTDIFIFYINNEPAGFAELVKEDDFTEIQYFGLLPAYIGKGLGNYFLRRVIQQAWSNRPKWIQINTCTLDHPNALSVYLKAGFTFVRNEMQERKILVKE